MEFRRATSADAAELAFLRRCQMSDEGFAPDADICAELQDYFETALAADELVMWLAVDSSDIVAMGGICFYRLPPSYANPTGWVACVTNMYTRPGFRRLGLASVLLEKVLDEARVRGYSAVRLHASAGGRGLYEKRGFVEFQGYMSLRLDSE